VLRFHDPERDLRAVRLVSELTKRAPPAFARRRDSKAWQLAVARPDVDRMEYLLELEDRAGRTERVPDPDNPLRAPGPFGEKSVLEFSGYRPPAWLADRQAPAGPVQTLRVRSRTLRASVHGRLWSSVHARPGAAVPLLVVHDGPEYADYAGLVRFLDVAAAAGQLPPMRAALLAPVDRDRHYSASAAYTSALVKDVLPALAAIAPSGGNARIGVGASFGALALLHAHRTHPGSFDALFLQSGSFFQPQLDQHESGFARFRRITAFVEGVLQADTWPAPVPVSLTCGTAEENVANNRALAAALGRQGYPVAFHEQRDAHNWVSWRDSLTAGLPRLIATFSA
jgi:enterochelin esterase-like enzyme